MSKKKTVMLAGLSLLLTAGTVALLIFLVKHEPNFYTRAEAQPGKDRSDRSTAFLGRFALLANNWVDGPQAGKPDWDVTFSEAQINSFFEEHFVRLGDAEVLRKQGITHPRIVMEDDKLRLAFRYGSPPWSTIISYDLKMWLAPRERNVICMEILARHAGALPIATQSLLNEISEVAAGHGFDISWYRHDSNPVALIRIQTDQARTPVQLKRLEIRPGVISIGGMSLETIGANTNGNNALAPVGN